jgi:hypothetical protein
MPIENGDRSTEVGLRPELRFFGLHEGIHGADLDGGSWRNALRCRVSRNARREGSTVPGCTTKQTIVSAL